MFNTHLNSYKLFIILCNRFIYNKNVNFYMVRDNKRLSIEIIKLFLILYITAFFVGLSGVFPNDWLNFGCIALITSLGFTLSFIVRYFEIERGKL